MVLAAVVVLSGVGEVAAVVLGGNAAELAADVAPPLACRNPRLAWTPRTGDDHHAACSSPRQLAAVGVSCRTLLSVSSA